MEVPPEERYLYSYQLNGLRRTVDRWAYGSARKLFYDFDLCTHDLANVTMSSGPRYTSRPDGRMTPNIQAMSYFPANAIRYHDMTLASCHLTIKQKAPLPRGAQRVRHA